MIALLLERLRRAAGQRPSASGWAETALLALGFAVVATPLALRAELIGSTWLLPVPESLALGLRVLLVPALLEEVLFRVLPNPGRAEASGRLTNWVSAASSVTAYVLIHPAAALLGGGAQFTDPTFLALVALLGVSCLVAYRRTGSLWPAVLIHWLVVVGWLGLGGHGPLSGV
ncbi:MAG: CPBP family glutamic-type intramembrane protease [Trueperaceae bacterium]